MMELGRGSKELSKKTNFFWINPLEMQWKKGGEGREEREES